MPYVSKAQQGWAHTPAGMKALGGPEKVAEWDRASKGMKLPKRSAGEILDEHHKKMVQRRKRKRRS